MNKPQYTLGLLGCGNMGEAILGGVLENGFLNTGEVTYYDRSSERSKYIGNAYGIFASGGVSDLVRISRHILVAVKPQDVIDVLEEVKKSFDPAHNKIISIAAGVSTGIFESYLGNCPSVIRIMPNTPSLVNMGISAISKGSFVSQDDFDFAAGVIKSLGDFVAIKESLQNTVTAVSGSGPAYFFLFCKYLIESAIDGGIDKEIAVKLVIETMAGSAAMLQKISTDTDYLINMVASPGGTTERAIEKFNAMGIENIIRSAVRSAQRRAEEIQSELEKK